MNMRERLVKVVARKWQFRNFGVYNEKGEFVIEAVALDAFEALCNETADAVLDELMTPTEGMEDAGWDDLPDDESKFNPETIFTAMIKAAKEGN